MNPVLRTLWICLLLLALPVQGFAAARMMQCGPGHARMQHTDGTAQHDGHEHHDHQAESPSQADDMSQHGSLPAAKHHCSACAACCVGMALPSSAPVLATPLESLPLVAATGGPDPVFLTSGLERPPRTLRA